MTKEEILQAHYPSLIRQEDEFGLASIYEAMEEYAQQQVKNCSIPDVSVRKIVRCEDPMVCLRGCSVHEQTCKHPIYEP